MPALVATGLAFGFCLAGLGYPWQFAVLTATAIGALVYSAQSTWFRLRGLYGQPGPTSRLRNSYFLKSRRDSAARR